MRCHILSVNTQKKKNRKTSNDKNVGKQAFSYAVSKYAKLSNLFGWQFSNIRIFNICVYIHTYASLCV